MKQVLVTGGTGLVGRALVEALRARGDSVSVVSRSPTQAALELPKDVRVLGSSALALDEGLRDADAVVHLAGEPVAQRWTQSAKKRIRSSRVDSTRDLVAALARAPKQARVFVCASAIGYYGARPANELLDENARPGTGFLAEVVQAWEQAAEAAATPELRVVRLRLGVVLAKQGGAFPKMLLPFKLWVGGPVGTGEQVLSWVHLADVVGLLLFAIDHPEVPGVLNAVAPSAVTSEEFAHTLGHALGRPSRLRTPAMALRATLGEASEIVLTGQHVLPRAALAAGYEFRYATLEPALTELLDN